MVKAIDCKLGVKVKVFADYSYYEYRNCAGVIHKLHDPYNYSYPIDVMMEDGSVLFLQFNEMEIDNEA